MPPSPSLLSTRHGPRRRPTAEGGGSGRSVDTTGRSRKSLAPASAARRDATSSRSASSPPHSSARRSSRSPSGRARTASKTSSMRRQRSVATGRDLVPREPPVEPGPGETPAAADRGVGHAEEGGDLVVLQTAEEAQIHDAGERLVL